MAEVNDPRKMLAEIKARLDDCQSYNFGTRRLAYEDAPALVAAIEAVMGVHSPVEGLHGHLVCSHRHCVDDSMDQVRHPCPTVTAITTALSGEW